MPVSTAGQTFIEGPGNVFKDMLNTDVEAVQV